MIQLHYYPSTAAMVPHILLEEIGVSYQRVLVDRMQGAHKTPDYLKLNPERVDSGADRRGLGAV